MRPLLWVILSGATVISLYDGIGAFIALSIGFDYGWLAIGSFVFYVLFGFLAGRTSGWICGLAIGAFLGLIDSTLGWAISWTIGPGKPSAVVNVLTVGVTIVFVTIVAAVLGLIGGLISLLAKRNA